MRKPLACVTVFLISVAANGCSSEPRGTVTGTVKLDGKPLPTGSVYMESADGKLNGAGPIGADGSFTVPNAPTGKVKVALIIPAPPPDLGAPQKKLPATSADLPKGENLTKEQAVLLAKVPAKYKEAAKSGLTFEVASGTNQPFEIAIKSTD